MTGGTEFTGVSAAAPVGIATFGATAAVLLGGALGCLAVAVHRGLLVAALSLCVVQPTSGQTTAPQERVQMYIALFTEPAVDCGVHGRLPVGADAFQQSLECARAARGRGETFLTMKAGGVPGATSYEGLLGTPRGEIYQFSFFERCGVPGCGERFTVRRCPVPLLHNQSFSCSLASNSTYGVQRPEEYVAALAGAKAHNCGRHGIGEGEEALEQSLQCAIASSKRRQAFQTIRQLQGIDSLVYDGLLGLADGRLFRLEYDSAPCGGPGCFGSFTIEWCPTPHVIGDGFPRFACVR